MSWRQGGWPLALELIRMDIRVPGLEGVSFGGGRRGSQEPRVKVWEGISET